VVAGFCDSLFGAGSSLLVKDGKAVVGLSLSDKQPLENPKVIKHFDVMYCMVMSCVGGEVTVLMEPAEGRGSASLYGKGVVGFGGGGVWCS